MNWYKKAYIDRELGSPYIPDEEEYAYMTGGDLNVSTSNEEKAWEKQQKENVIYHEKMTNISIVEENIKKLKEKIKILEEERKYFYKLSRNPSNYLIRHYKDEYNIENMEQAKALRDNFGRKEYALYKEIKRIQEEIRNLINTKLY